MPIDRAWLTSLQDDSGSNLDGSVIDKDLFTDIADAIDDALPEGVTSDGTDVTAIAFSAAQVPSADPNTLDDYQEGSWTPVIGGVTSQTGQAYSIQIGRYTKIGNRCHFECYVLLSTAGTITGNVLIRGLPFTAKNLANLFVAVAVGFWQNLATAAVAVTGYIGPGSTTIFMNLTTAAIATPAPMANTAIGNSSGFIIAGSYEVD